jgi:hypothetical protein
MKYERLTEKRATPLTMSMWGGSSKDLRIYNRLAEYEDDEESGKIVRLPCKVGDTVYIPWAYDGVCSIAFFTVKYIIFSHGKAYIRTYFDTDDTGFYNQFNGGQFDFSDFGKTVFLTREEAEKRLKELQNG